MAKEFLPSQLPQAKTPEQLAHERIEMSVYHARLISNASVAFEKGRTEQPAEETGPKEEKKL